MEPFELASVITGAVQEYFNTRDGHDNITPEQVVELFAAFEVMKSTLVQYLEENIDGNKNENPKYS